MATIQKPAVKAAPAVAGAWSEEIQLAGSEAASVGGSKELPANAKGKVECKCLNVTPLVKNDGSGKRTIAFKMQVVKPAFLAGLIFGKINADPKNEKARNFWNTTLQSFGAPAAALQKGPLKIGTTTFQGKNCYMYLDPVKNSKGYDTREFLTPADFEAQAWPDENAEAPAVNTNGQATEAAVETPAWQ
jgi:hypothetical protein